MNNNDENTVREALKAAFEPVNGEMRRDLWPTMLRRIDQQSTRVAWYDWLLGGAVAVGLAAFPQVAVMLFYHL